MAWWNPRDWFRKSEPSPEAEALAVFAPPAPETPGVLAYVRFSLDRPFDGIFWREPAEKPWVLIEGLSYDEAAGWLPGKSLDWGRIPLAWRECLEKAPGYLVVPHAIFKEFVK